MPNGTTPNKMGSSSRTPSQNSRDGEEGVSINFANYRRIFVPKYGDSKFKTIKRELNRKCSKSDTEVRRRSKSYRYVPTVWLKRFYLRFSTLVRVQNFSNLGLLTGRVICGL